MFEVHGHFHLSMKRWDYLVAKMVRNPPGFHPLVGKILWRWAWQPTPVFLPGRIPRDRESWWATVHGIARSQTWLNDWAQSALAKEVGSWVNDFLNNKSKHFMLALTSEVINQGKTSFSYLHPLYPWTWKCTRLLPYHRKHRKDTLW